MGNASSQAAKAVVRKYPAASNVSAGTATAERAASVAPFAEHAFSERRSTAPPGLHAGRIPKDHNYSVNVEKGERHSPELAVLVIASYSLVVDRGGTAKSFVSLDRQSLTAVDTVLSRALGLVFLTRILLFALRASG
jgi:hypothetical protein